MQAWRLQVLKLQANPSNGWQDTEKITTLIMSVRKEYKFSGKSLQRTMKNSQKELCYPSKVPLISDRSEPNLHHL